MHTNIGKYCFVLAPNSNSMSLIVAHFDHHGSSKIKKKAQINAKATGLTTKALFPDRLEILRDDNI